MATKSLRGDAPAVAKVQTVTIGSSTAAQTFYIERNGKRVTYTAGAGETTASVAAALQALLDASTIAEFRECSWTYPGTGAIITATAQDAGRPATFTAGGTGTISTATPTPSAGPSDASTVANWSGAALPANTDNLIIARGADLLYGLEALAPPVALAGLQIKASYEAAIGLPPVNEGEYLEDRTRQFPVATGVPVKIGEGEGSGPTRVMLVQTGVADITVLRTAERQGGTSYPVVNISGATSGSLVVAAGDVGLAADDDTLTGTITTASVGEGGTLTIGPGATVGTMNQTGGRVVNYGSVGTVNGSGGTFDHYGTITVAVNADPGPFTFNWRCGGTIPSVTFRGQGPGQNAPKMECSLDPRDKIMTVLSFMGGAVLSDPDEVTEWVTPGEWDAASVLASNIGSRYYLLRADSTGTATALKSPAAVTASTNGSTIDLLTPDGGPCFAIQHVGTFSGTGTLTGRIEESVDGAVWTTAANFTVVSGANNLQRVRFWRSKRYVRWAATVVQTAAPSFTTDAVVFEDF
jgi:hypothetical protein